MAVPDWVVAQDRVAPLDRVGETVCSPREGAGGVVRGGHLSLTCSRSVAGLARRIKKSIDGYRDCCRRARRPRGYENNPLKLPTWPTLAQVQHR